MKTLRLHLQKDISPVLTSAVGIGFFVLATALGAYIRIPIPFTPVPLTLQTFFVLLGGALLGAPRACTAQALYCTLGFFGIPLFTLGTAGFAYLCGPTGGYLIGFIMASVFLGRVFATVPLSAAKVLLYMGIASAIILSFGSLHLAFVMHVSPLQAITAGFIPFIPGDIAKTVAAAGLYRFLIARKISF